MGRTPPGQWGPQRPRNAIGLPPMQKRELSGPLPTQPIKLGQEVGMGAAIPAARSAAVAKSMSTKSNSEPARPGPAGGFYCESAILKVFSGDEMLFE